MKEVGILCAISSLCGEYGIGDFGIQCQKFIDILKKNKVSYWQILPLNPTGYGHSPYQPYSSFALDPIYICLDDLYRDKLISKKEKITSSEKVDYFLARQIKEHAIKEAYFNFIKNNHFDYVSYAKDNPGLAEYACFIALKEFNENKSWEKWDNQEILTTNIDELPPEIALEAKIQLFAQKILLTQWLNIKEYANKSGIKIIGDLPFYVGLDSSDVYYARDFFLLDENHSPKLIAGVPPDYFSKTGQRWGNPIYNWDALKKDDYGFLSYRIYCANQLYDVVRLDHFRAFDSYWAINPRCETAIDGKWCYPNGYDFFNALYQKYPSINLIAEDLGDLRKEVLILKDHFHLPGMKIMQFTILDELKRGVDNDAIDTIYYTGTHDNDTLLGWYSSLTKKEKTLISRYHISYHKDFDAMDKLLYIAMHKRERLTIFPLQDVLRLPSKARMNTPSTINEVNWTWKIKDFSDVNSRLGFIKKCIK